MDEWSDLNAGSKCKKQYTHPLDCCYLGEDIWGTVPEGKERCTSHSRREMEVV